MLGTLLGCAGLSVLLEGSDDGCAESAVAAAALWLNTRCCWCHWCLLSAALLILAHGQHQELQHYSDSHLTLSLPCELPCTHAVLSAWPAVQVRGVSALLAGGTAENQGQGGLAALDSAAWAQLYV